MRWWMVALAGGCAPEPAACKLQDSLDDLAGPGATACGAYTALEDPGPGWTCALTAYRAGDPFVFRYDEGTLDSALLFGVASDGDRLFFLYQGKDRGVVRDVDGRECVEPVEVSGILDCEAYQPADRVWQFCTTATDEPYQLPYPG